MELISKKTKAQSIPAMGKPVQSPEHSMSYENPT